MTADKLTIIQLLPELEEGGVEGETVDLAVYLAGQGHNSIVISGGGRMVKQLEDGGCTHILWPHIGEKSFRCLPYIFKLKEFILENKVDILHLRSRLPAWIGYFAWKLLPEQIRPSLVTTFHGFYSVNSYSCIMTKGERVAAVSSTIQEHIEKNYKIDSSRIRLIHGGFDEDFFNPDNVTPERINTLKNKWLKDKEYQKIIVLPGRLTFWKGQDVLIDACAQLKQREKILCLLIGDKEDNISYTAKLQDKIKRHGLEENILLVGHCLDMPAALMLADVVVSASSTQPEAFGKVAIEAMAMAKPVVATAHGGSLETVVDENTGWLVPPGNASALAKVLDKVLFQTDDVKKYGERGRARVQEHFTARKMCEKTLVLYKDIYLEKQRKREKKSFTVMQLVPELNSGGVERGTLELGHYLVNNGHKSIVVSGGGRLVKDLERDGSIHLQKNIGAKSPVVLRHILPLRSLLKNNIDVLHMRSRMPAWVGYITWLTIPPKKRPVLITTFHGFYSVNKYSAIMTKGDGVIAVSSSIRAHIEDNYGRSRNLRLIFRGVDSEIFHPKRIEQERIEKLSREWALPSAGGPVIMLPGRFTRLKGQKIFIQSLALVKKHNFQAVLVGDTGDNPGYITELKVLVSESGLEGRVHFVGHCSDMPAALMLSDFVVSASSLEPEAFGRTTVEAMAMGKPVIVTAHGGSLETVIDGENGWFVKPSDPEDLARGITRALSAEPQQIERISKNNMKRVADLFTTRSMCEQTVQFYSDLLQARNNLVSEQTCKTMQR